MKNAKEKNTTTTRITNAKYLGKKEINTRCLSQNSWNITAKKKQTNVPLESSENPTLMHMFFNRASRLPPLCCCAGYTALNRLHPWWRICWYFSCFEVFTMILWHFWCDDNVNISALEFHHCHHVFVGFYLEYSLLSLFPTKMDMGCGWAQHVSQQF